MSIHRKHKGARNELAAACWLLEQGYEVFRNVSAHGSVDIIATRNGEIHFFDVTGAPNRRGTKEQVSKGVKFLVRTDDGDFIVLDVKEVFGLEKLECLWCEDIFQPRTIRHKYCSVSCQESARRSRLAEDGI